MVKIQFINSTGGGFAEFKNIPEGTSVESFVAENVSGPRDSYSVRVNHEIAVASYILRENDKVSILPLKLAGAKPRRAFRLVA